MMKYVIRTVCYVSQFSEKPQKLLWHHISTHQNFPSMTYNDNILVAWISGITQLIRSWCIKNNPTCAKRVKNKFSWRDILSDLMMHLYFYRCSHPFFYCCYKVLRSSTEFRILSFVKYLSKYYTKHSVCFTQSSNYHLWT